MSRLPPALGIAGGRRGGAIPTSKQQQVFENDAEHLQEVVRIKCHDAVDASLQVR